MQAQRTFASEGRIRKSLSRVASLYHQRQRGAERQINPQPYTAEYHGHKLHMDQNEKLVNYGVVHVCAIDGFSRFIPSFACMPTKNNVECGNLRVQNLTFLRAKYLVCLFLRVLSIYFTGYRNHPCSHTVSRYSVIVFSLLPTLIN